MIRLISSVIVGLTASAFPVFLNNGTKTLTPPPQLKVSSEGPWNDIASWRKFEQCREYRLNCDSFLPKNLPEEVKYSLSGNYRNSVSPANK